MRGHVFSYFCIAAALLAAAKAQIVLGDEKTKIQCVNDTICSEQFGDMAICDFEYCDCKSGSEFEPTEGKCTEAISTFRSGKKCSTDRDCTMEDSRCRFGECKCDDNFIESQITSANKCLPVAGEVGWGCEEDIQCTTKLNKTTECKDYTCVCKSGTTINHLGACIEAKGLDAFCSNNAVCTTEHSECRQGVCACTEGYVSDSSSSRCLEVAHGYKSPCEESIQCTESFGTHSECKKRECTCTVNHHFSDMECWEDKGLQQRCDRPSECFIAEDGANQKLQCTAGFCICKPEYEPDLSTLRCSGATSATISGLSFVILASLMLV